MEEELDRYGSEPGSEDEAGDLSAVGLFTGEEQQEGEIPPEPSKRKKTVKNPQPKLDQNRLLGPRGVTAVEDYFKDVQLKGKGNELNDLDLIMGKLQLWTHRLFPKMKFDDALERIETLGHKKPVQAQLRKVRLGLITQDDIEGIVNDNDEQDEAAANIDSLPDDNATSAAFDDFFADQGFRSQPGRQMDSSDAGPSASQAPPMSDEIRQKIEDNRRKAQERLKAKREAATSSSADPIAAPQSMTTAAITQSQNGTSVSETPEDGEGSNNPVGDDEESREVEQRIVASEDSDSDKENESFAGAGGSPSRLVVDEDSDLESRASKRQRRCAVFDSDSD